MPTPATALPLQQAGASSYSAADYAAAVAHAQALAAAHAQAAQAAAEAAKSSSSLAGLGSARPPGADASYDPAAVAAASAYYHAAYAAHAAQLAAVVQQQQQQAAIAAHGAASVPALAMTPGAGAGVGAGAGAGATAGATGAEAAILGAASGGQGYNAYSPAAYMPAYSAPVSQAAPSAATAGGASSVRVTPVASTTPAAGTKAPAAQQLTEFAQRLEMHEVQTIATPPPPTRTGECSRGSVRYITCSELLVTSPACPPVLWLVAPAPGVPDSTERRSMRRSSSSRRPTLPGEGIKPGSVYDRLTNPHNYTGVYRRVHRSGGGYVRVYSVCWGRPWLTRGVADRINAFSESYGKYFTGNTNDASNSAVHEIKA